MTQEKEMFSKNVVYKNDGGIFQFPFSKTREKMMKILIEETERVGRIVTFTEFSKISDAPQPNEYSRYGWTSFSEAATEAWQRLQGSIQTRLTEKGKKLVEYLREHPTPKTDRKVVTKEQQTTQRTKPTGPIPRFD